MLKSIQLVNRIVELLDQSDVIKFTWAGQPIILTRSKVERGVQYKVIRQDTRQVILTTVDVIPDARNTVAGLLMELSVASGV